ncbi:MAG: prepilin peptidase [Parcubacteria group bacterium]|nr:prepilin peptidase [Parcubacteria group bacterium]
MSSLLVFLLGLSVGSFVNVIADRFDSEKDKGFVALTSGRSRCDHCKRMLGVGELVPILSFLTQKGRSRCCSKKLGLHYPIIELIMGGLFLLVWYRAIGLYALLSTSFFIIISFWFLFVALLVALALIDLRTYLLPDRLMFPGIILALAYPLIMAIMGTATIVLYHAKQWWLSPLSGALLFGGLLYLIYLISRGRAMGFGDVKLGIFGGLMLGLPLSGLAFFLSFIFGAIVGVALLLRGKKGIKDMIPFGPFVVLGILVALFYGDWILHWYFGLIYI